MKLECKYGNEANCSYVAELEKLRSVSAVNDLNGLRKKLITECNEIIDLLIRKRADYGPYNILRFGERGIVIRVSDKVDRLINLTNETLNETLNETDETLIDTWRDIAGYALLALIARRG